MARWLAGEIEEWSGQMGTGRLGSVWNGFGWPEMRWVGVGMEMGLKLGEGTQKMREITGFEWVGGGGRGRGKGREFQETVNANGKRKHNQNGCNQNQKQA